MSFLPELSSILFKLISKTWTIFFFSPNFSRLLWLYFSCNNFVNSPSRCPRPFSPNSCSSPSSTLSTPPLSYLSPLLSPPSLPPSLPPHLNLFRKWKRRKRQTLTTSRALDLTMTWDSASSIKDSGLWIQDAGPLGGNRRREGNFVQTIQLKMIKVINVS